MKRLRVFTHGAEQMSLEHSPARQTRGGPKAERAVYTIAEFCDSHRISRSKLYELWKAGLGPRYMWVGNQRRITVEAAADYRRDLEAVSPIGRDHSTASESGS
jgi:hypothetical protein